MQPLRSTSCMAPNMDYISRAVIDYLARRLGKPIDFVIDLPWPERLRQLQAGAIQMGWICGAPYVERSAHPLSAPPLELLAAPVWRDPLYGDSPIYYSHLLVQRASAVQSFGDLRGQRWVYNDRGSLSGYHILRAYLWSLGEDDSFFAQQIEAGSHQHAVQMVAEGQADVAAVDSTVLQQMAQDEAEAGKAGAAATVRTLTLLGPNPMPPWVIGSGVPVALRQAIRHWLIHMAQDATGAAILAKTPIARFVAIEPQAYQPIAEILRQSRQQLCSRDSDKVSAELLD